jgi:hypothetical protein
MLWDIGTGSGNYAHSTGVKESVIVDKMIKALEKKYPKAVIWKIHGGGYQRAGMPDIYIQIQGKAVWVEAKRPEGDTTALQHRALQMLSTAGAYVGVATSTQEILTLIEDVLRTSNKI